MTEFITKNRRIMVGMHTSTEVEVCLPVILRSGRASNGSESAYSFRIQCARFRDNRLRI